MLHRGAAVATGTVDLGLVDGLAAPSDPLRLPDVAPLTTHCAGEEPVRVLPGRPPAGPAPRPAPRRPRRRPPRLPKGRGRCPQLDAPDAGLPLAHLRAANGGHGFRPALRYEGTDVRTLTTLAAAGHGLALLPESAATAVPGATAVALTHPRVVHRTELVYVGSLAGAAVTPARALGARG